MQQPHFDVAANRKMPITVLCYLEPDIVVIDYPVFGGEALEKLKGISVIDAKSTRSLFITVLRSRVDGES